MRKALLIVLLAVASFEAGVAFDRWLHRPIVTKDFTIRMGSTAAPEGELLSGKVVDPDADYGVVHCFPHDCEVCNVFGNICTVRL